MSIKAKLVYDGSDVHIPEEMGLPSATQMQGTVAEQLTELAGRVCYDSLGKGRSSADYHKHIQEVGHGSVWEHFNFTIVAHHEDLPYLVNRPGIHFEWSDLTPALRVTMNLRNAIEYGKFLPYSGNLENKLRVILNHHFPTLYPSLPVDRVSLLTPKFDSEKWVTFWLQCSRGCSHELVRHGDWTAISQRSTRYVDESESNWIPHPLSGTWTAMEESTIDDCKYLYTRNVESLQAKLLSEGCDKQTARKQARGAARGILGNALETQLIFSASVAQWKHMLHLRMSKHADAEIRVLFNQIFAQLKTCAYADSFIGMKAVPSPDGIGEVLDD